MGQKKSKPKTAAKTGLPVGKLAISKDPRVYATTLPAIRPMHKRILGLDLGRTTGVSFCDIIPGYPVTNAKIVMGQWDLNVSQYDSGVLRHVRLKQFLAILSPDLILFENVKYDMPLDAIAAKKMGPGAIVARITPTAEFFGGLKTTLATWAHERNIPCEAVEIAQIKAYAVGGRANKEAMIKAANERFGTNFDPETYEQTGADNIVDSAFVCAMGVERYSEGLTDDGNTNPETNQQDSADQVPA